MNGPIQVEWGKVLLLVMAMAAGIVLLVRGETSEGVGLIGTILGYTVGNGRLASAGKEPVPMIRSTRGNEPGGPQR